MHACLVSVTELKDRKKMKEHKKRKCHHHHGNRYILLSTTIRKCEGERKIEIDSSITYKVYPRCLLLTLIPSLLCFRSFSFLPSLHLIKIAKREDAKIDMICNHYDVCKFGFEGWEELVKQIKENVTILLPLPVDFLIEFGVCLSFDSMQKFESFLLLLLLHLYHHLLCTYFHLMLMMMIRESNLNPHTQVLLMNEQQQQQEKRMKSRTTRWG